MNLLVIIDPQNDFITGPFGSDMAEIAAENIVKKIKNFNAFSSIKETIFVTLDTHNKKTYLNSPEGEKLPILHCEKYTNGWLIEPNIRNELNDNNVHFIEKSNFWSDALIEQIEKYACHISKSESITIVGFCTDICVLYNALRIHAALPNIKVCVDVSCCAGSTLENHRAAIAVMKACQIDIIGGYNEKTNQE